MTMNFLVVNSSVWFQSLGYGLKPSNLILKGLSNMFVVV